MDGDNRLHTGHGPGRIGLPFRIFHSPFCIHTLCLLAILALAFSLRLVHVEQLKDSPFFDRHVMDPLYHHQWARAFADGQEREFVPGAYFRAPLYPWMLGTIYWLFGESAVIPRVVQAVIGALSCGLLYLIGVRLFGRVVGIVAGLSAATYGMLIYYDGELKVEGLAIFLTLLTLLLVLLARDRPSWWLWGLSGVALGLAAITRPNVLLFAPALVVWIVWLYARPVSGVDGRRRAGQNDTGRMTDAECGQPDVPRSSFVIQWKRIFGYSFALFIGTILPILPVTIRNVAVGNDFALIATSGGVNFYIGNNPGSDGMSAVIPGDPPAWWPCYYAQIERAERAEGRSLTGAEVSRWYTRQAWKWILENPSAAAALTLRKLGYFWSHWEVSNNQDIPFVLTHYAPLARALPLGFWLVGPLGALGVLLALRRPREMFPLWGFVLIYMVSVVIFFVSARYRIPAVPVLILLAAYAAVWIVQQVIALRWRPLLITAPLLAGMALVVSRTPPGIDFEMIQGHVAAGMFLAADEKFDRAEPLLEQAVLRSKRTGWRLQPEVPQTLGQIRIARGAFDAAVEPLEYAVQLAPQSAAGRQLLGVALAGANRLNDAAEQFRAALSIAPDNSAFQANLGNALVQTDRIDEGLPLLIAAIRADARFLDTLLAAAESLGKRGRPRQMLSVLEAGREAMPDDHVLLAMLIQLRLSPVPAARDPQEALQLAERLLETAGEDALALHLASLAAAATGDAPRAAGFARRALDAAQRAQRGDLVREIERHLRTLPPP